MAIYTIEDITVIVQRMITYFQTAQSDITDFNTGSEVRNLLEAIGVSAYEQRYLIDFMFRMGYPHTATGVYLDMIGILVNCHRTAATKSVGGVTFTIPEAELVDIVFPVGTELYCSTDTDLTFKTTEEATITAGATEVEDVATEAVTAGTTGNVAAGKIDRLSVPIVDVEVINDSEFEGGAPEEADIPFRIRILDAGKGNITGTVAWYKQITETVTGVHDAYVINNPGGGADVKILVNGNVKPTPDAVMDEVEEIWYEDETKIIGGVTVEVAKPDYVVQDVEADVTLNTGYLWADVEPQLLDDIECYFQGGTTSYGELYLGLDAGANIVKSKINKILADHPGVLDYTVTLPEANITVMDFSAAQLGNITLTNY